MHMCRLRRRRDLYKTRVFGAGKEDINATGEVVSSNSSQRRF